MLQCKKNFVSIFLQVLLCTWRLLRLCESLYPVHWNKTQLKLLWKRKAY